MFKVFNCIIMSIIFEKNIQAKQNKTSTLTKYLIFFFLFIFSMRIAIAQNKISGIITDSDHLPLPGASVFIPEMNKGTVSDQNGNYELMDLPNGKVKIQFSFVGCTNRVETVVLSGKAVELNILLKETPIEADEIVVTGGYNSTQHDNAVKIDVLKMNPAAIQSTPNFTEVLTKVPGVDMISKGSGVSKPVIRGLSMNDILVLNNGVRYENYQYSSHHPLGIDEFGIENIDIIKGPASLLYGSDAIGGVINFIKEKPAQAGDLIGDYNLQLFSNTLGMINNLGIRGSSGKISAGIRLGQKTNSDFLQSGGAFAPNSRFNEWSAKANAGFTDKVGTFNLYYDYNNEKLGMVEQEAIDQVTERGRKNQIWYQELNTHLVSSQNKFYLGRFKLDANASYQNTELAHIAEVDVTEIQMKLATITYEAKLHLPSSENSEYIIGFQGFNQKNSNVNHRETILLPNANTNTYAGFGLVQHTFFSKMKVQAGLRYDTKLISTEAIGQASESGTYRPALDKTFGSFSGSIGATYNLTEKLLFRANFASAYRTPNLAELTSNGQHETRYEIGNPSLVSENSYESDLSIHYHSDNFTFEVSGFYNSINNYIFISPTGQNTPTGIPIYRYKQANSSLIGGEAGMHIHPKPIPWLHFETTFASVEGKQKNGDYLPFIPAHKLRFELRAEKEELLFVKNAFVSLTTVTAFAQNHAAPDETPTKGYTLTDLSIGGNLHLKKQLVILSLGANNLFDVRYVDHLSTLKEVGLYNPGRNISLSLKVPFGSKGNP
jgi:iron complex outermembrane recepter protein